MSISELGISFNCTPIHETAPPAEEHSIAIRIVEAVAELEGVDALDLPPLQDVIDSDALDRLLGHETTGPDSPVAICFTYNDWQIFVRDDGSIVIGDPDETGDSTPVFRQE